MRLDRLLTLYFFRPLLKFKRMYNEPRIVILMYHSVSKPKGTFSHPYYEVCTSSETFEVHMKFLYENNYHVIGLDQVITLLNHSSELRKQTKSSKSVKSYVVLTFDDGFRDFYTQAFPILQRYNFPATVFLPTAFIGENRKKFKGKDCLIWSEIHKLKNMGISFGSHTVSHPKLIELDKARLEYELQYSKKIIEKKNGGPIKSFCYPYAFPVHDRKFITLLTYLVKKSGYHIVLTTMIGTISIGNFQLFLPRIPINDFDDEIFFKSKLQGVYDWTRMLQIACKRTRKLIS